ncbi:hypothetical protein BDA99DRAFT_540810 [Phascolomyces articulosus]|uniref:Uncharacterized protein n=1 Tax=Phascolomyces articulosus TaxID=60185 RepID=A0AAD5PAL9_9FUNG|nr:hypothetical protein BDA99DRAFT_540810 [Phascolomyces articulosus]
MFINTRKNKNTLALLLNPLLIFSILIQNVSSLSVSNISECPPIPARSGPSDIGDLRPDDIKVIGALGDSIMAGFALEGINDDLGGTGLLNLSTLTEFRGKSWGIGGDEGAITLANLVKHYNSSLEGPSVGKHFAYFCKEDDGDGCDAQFKHGEVDVLDAAISGGIAASLDMELDYLLQRMAQLPNVNLVTDWKMITIQIGSNDQCASCSGNNSDVTADAYAAYVDAAVQRIRNNVPRVLVNLVGTFNVSGLYELTRGQQYCRPLFGQPDWILNRMECSCFKGTDQDRANMDTLSAQYNAKLFEIYQKYNAEKTEGFAIAYTPANINVGGLPLEALSNVDCFHPGRLAHEWISKVVWNNIFKPQAEKPYSNILEYNANEQIYCPTEDDRIRID